MPPNRDVKDAAGIAEPPPSKYVLSLDVGTTTVKALVYDDKANVVGSGFTKAKVLQPQLEWSEMCPDELLGSVTMVGRAAILAAKLSPENISCVGMSTQRSSFITWSKSTGRPFHNFILWKDVRANQMCDKYNNSWLAKGFRCACRVLHQVFSHRRLLRGSILKIPLTCSFTKLAWVLENVPEAKAAAETGDLLFGTVDTWLLHKMSTLKGLHVTEEGNFCATGFYDVLASDNFHLGMFFARIPSSVMPKLVDTASDEGFGRVRREVFGAEIPIRAVMADQSASMLGLGCLSEGDAKMTLGTGSFFGCCTGKWPGAASRADISTLTMFKVRNWKSYMLETSLPYSSLAIEWAEMMNLFDSPDASSEIARSAPDPEGLFFVPAFGGLGPPVNDVMAAAGFIGLSHKHGKEHLLRAVLESIAFGVMQLVETFKKGVPHWDRGSSRSIGVDGGISKNDFVLQTIANLIRRPVERRISSEMSAFGVAFMAGLQSGIWKSGDDLSKLKKVDVVFHPDREEVCLKVLDKYRQWVQACKRFQKWHGSRKM